MRDKAYVRAMDTVYKASIALAAANITLFIANPVLGALYNAPFVRADTGVVQAFGPGGQAALSGGRELLSERLVLAASLRFEHEFPLSLRGAMTARSDSSSLAVSVSGAFKVTSHWTVTAAVSSDAPGHLGLAQNREERLGFMLGVRRGFF